MKARWIWSVLLILLIGLSGCGWGRELQSIPTFTAQPTEAAPRVPVVEETQPMPAVTSIPDTVVPTKSLPTTGCPAIERDRVSSGSVLELGPGEGMPASAAQGEKLVLFGRLFARDCVPIAGAVLEVWQTDSNGEYGPGHGTDEMQCCYLMGSVETDEQGAFVLHTVMPGHYKGEAEPPPAHLHGTIRLPGNDSQARPVDLEIVFAGDPYLPEGVERHSGYALVSLVKEMGLEGETLTGDVPIMLDVDPP